MCPAHLPFEKQVLPSKTAHERGAFFAGGERILAGPPGPFDAAVVALLQLTALIVLGYGIERGNAPWIDIKADHLSMLRKKLRREASRHSRDRRIRPGHDLTWRFLICLAIRQKFCWDD